MTLDILNETPFPCVPFGGRIGFPGYSMSVAVKGTFELSPDGTAVAGEQLFPSGDAYYPDDEGMLGAPRYPSDFACLKPCTDLVLVGSCHAPGGAAPRSRVTFEVGDWRRVLAVFGERTREEPEPRPFASMPLRFENSFGGIGFARNPVGKGIDSVVGTDGRRVTPLPNVEDPEDLVHSPDHRPEPAGFGALPPAWAQRHGKLGTYTADYLEERWPWFAADFDWGYFNAAPAAMQREGYLRGDESLYFENLHPEHAGLRSRLPGLRVRCFVNLTATGDAERTGFREIDMCLDTLWVDMDALRLVLVWRGWMEVRSEEFEEVAHLFVTSEALADPAGSLTDYRALFEQRLAEQEREGEFEVEEPAVTGEEEPAPEDVDEELAKAREAMRERLREHGIDPDHPPTPGGEELERETRILRELGFETTDAAPVTITRGIVEERAGAGVSLADEDLSGLELRGLSAEGLDLRAANLTGAALQNAHLAGARLAGASMAGIDLSQSDLREADLRGADLTGSRLVGANLEGANLADATFEGADLAGAVLTHVKARDAVFSRADLSAATAAQADFSGADFSGATLHGADLRRATLVEASLGGAVGHRVNLSGADLTELRASGGCDFSHGVFVNARGPDSIWEEALLEGADFSHAELAGANFIAAVMTGANLCAADMRSAALVKARLDGARMVRMNLFQASLEKADLRGADLRGSNLYGAETLQALLAATEFAGANLKMTKLAARRS